MFTDVSDGVKSFHPFSATTTWKIINIFQIKNRTTLAPANGFLVAESLLCLFLQLGACSQAKRITSRQKNNNLTAKTNNFTLKVKDSREIK